MIRYLLMLIFTAFLIISCDKPESKVELQEEGVYYLFPLDGRIEFSGFVWQVVETDKEEGFVSFGGFTHNDNIFVDDKGRLHLKISKIDGNWYGAELISENDFDFGKFVFEIDSSSNKLDKDNQLQFSVRRLITRNNTGFTEGGFRFYGSDDFSPYDIEYYMYSTDRKFASVTNPEFDTKYFSNNLYYQFDVEPDKIEYGTAKLDGDLFHFLSRFCVASKDKQSTDDEDLIIFAKPAPPFKVVLGFYRNSFDAAQEKDEYYVIIPKFEFIEYSLLSGN